jgi:hypothetical protein
MKRSFGMDVALALLLALGLSGLYFAVARPGQDWGGDFAQYIAHARNLAGGRPYTETLYIQTFPDAVIHMPAVYPPVFPLLLAPVYARFGLRYGPMEALTGGMFVAAALMIFVIARMRGLSPWLAAASAAAFGFSGIVLDLTDKILSDGTYLVFAGIALAMMILVERRGWDQTHPALAAAGVLVPMVLAYGARAIGLSLAVAFVLYALVERRLRLYHYLVVAGFAAAVLLYSATLYDTKSYRSGFEHELRIYLHNAVMYLRSPAALWAGSPAAFRYTALLITVPVAVAEWLRRLLFDRSIVEFYILAVILPVLVYSSAGTNRYMLPVLAFLLVYFLQGVEFWRARLKLGSWLPACACLLLAGGAALNVRGMEKGPYAQGVEQPSFTALCDYVTHNVDHDALMVSWNPRVLALYTDRPSAWYPQNADDHDLDAYLQQIGERYVLVYSGNPEDAGRLGPHLEHASNFTPVFHNSDFELYRRIVTP